jgi:Tol biopolymer transport system component
MLKSIVAVCIALASLIHSTSTWAEKPKDQLVSERLISKIKPNRISEFKVSPDGMQVAYVAGSGRYSEKFSDGEGKDWEKKTLVVDGKTAVREGQTENRWYEAGKGVVVSPDGKSVARVVSSNSMDPSYIIVNGNKSKSYWHVHSPLFSPDSKRLAYIATTHDPYGQFVVVDGQEGKRYDQVHGDGNLIFSPDSKRLSYIATNGSGKGRENFVVIDGQEGKHYAGINIDGKFSPDSQHFFYLAVTADRKWTAVVDEKEGKYFDAWHAGNPVFSPDSKRVAFLVTTQPDTGESFVVVDGQEGKRYKRVWPDYVRFSSDSKHVAYAANSGNEWFVVVDGKEGKRYDFVSDTTFSPNDSQLAYVAHMGSKAFVVHDGNIGKQYDQITGLVFSPDGKTLAYAAYAKKDKKWFVVINGQEGNAYDFVLAKNAYEENSIRSIETGSLRFDSSDKLRYLAVRKDNILLVESLIR